ncbi:MAG: 3-deoxy-D-manno-octulosonic acid kinase [Pseudomonadota bacterium]|nr:3-deoxy-D-manno-octulosonic acid kinase [Pseudomonadota bacterium]
MPAANERLLTFHDGGLEGAIVFDPSACPQTPQAAWFDPAHWGAAAEVIGSGGRGAAWRVDAPIGPLVLRHYLRGGLIAKLSRDRFVWRSQDAVRSFAEFRLMQRLRALALPVPQPVAASYRREGGFYRAAILMRRIAPAQSLGELLQRGDPPWQASGQLIAAFHRAGLDHADLNAHNILFDGERQGWMIDFDKSVIRTPAAAWQTANLQRLRRSLHKLGGAGSDAGYQQLLAAYAGAMQADAA